MPGIVDLQRKVKIPTNLNDFVQQAIGMLVENGSGSASIAFVTDEEITRLNKRFRKIDSTTDVLSFPYEPEGFEKGNDHLGDIVISAERAEKQAKENGLTVEIEIKQLILHGLLHLFGYDHETDDGEMDGLELELRGKLIINQ